MTLSTMAAMPFVCNSPASSYAERKVMSNLAICSARRRWLSPAASAVKKRRPVLTLAFSREEAEFHCSHGEQVDEAMDVLRQRIDEMPAEEEEYCVVEELDQEEERRRKCNRRHFSFLMFTQHMSLAAALLDSVPDSVLLGATHLLLALRALLMTTCCINENFARNYQGRT
jgi:hypothetical protein